MKSKILFQIIFIEKKKRNLITCKNINNIFQTILIAKKKYFK